MQQNESDIRRNREKFTLQLRKQNREETFLKRRNFGQADRTMSEEKAIESSCDNVVLDERYRQAIEQAAKLDYNKYQLPVIFPQLTSSNPTSKHQAVIALRKVISEHENHAIIQEVLDAGALPTILSLLREKEHPHVQFEASWIVSNIAAGTTAQCQAIIDKGGLQLLLELLSESHFRLNQQAIWAIGNIGGDSIKFRDLILQKNGIAVLCSIAEKSTYKSIIKRAAWAISNLCRGTPLPKFQTVKNGIVALAKITLTQVLDEDQLSDCLWAISNHCKEGQKSRIQKLVQISNFVPYLIQICKGNPKIFILVPALRIVGNISIGNELHTEEILKGGVLDLLKQLYKHEKKSIRKEACWITSNICAGTTSQVRQVVGKAELMIALGGMLWQEEIDVRKEIAYIFKNMGHTADKRATLEIYQAMNAVQGVVNLIRQDQDAQAIEIGLKCLFDMLALGSAVAEGGCNLVLRQLESIPGSLDRLQSLQHHKTSGIYDAVVKIFQQYFVLEDSLM